MSREESSIGASAVATEGAATETGPAPRGANEPNAEGGYYGH